VRECLVALKTTKERPKNIRHGSVCLGTRGQDNLHYPERCFISKKCGFKNPCSSRVVTKCSHLAFMCLDKLRMKYILPLFRNRLHHHSAFTKPHIPKIESVSFDESSSLPESEPTLSDVRCERLCDHPHVFPHFRVAKKYVTILMFSPTPASRYKPSFSPGISGLVYIEAPLPTTPLLLSSKRLIQLEKYPKEFEAPVYGSTLSKKRETPQQSCPALRSCFLPSHIKLQHSMLRKILDFCVCLEKKAPESEPWVGVRIFLELMFETNLD
jgi:hypothetical protein